MEEAFGQLLTIPNIRATCWLNLTFVRSSRDQTIVSTTTDQTLEKPLCDGGNSVSLRCWWGCAMCETFLFSPFGSYDVAQRQAYLPTQWQWKTPVQFSHRSKLLLLQTHKHCGLLFPPHTQTTCVNVKTAAACKDSATQLEKCDLTQALPAAVLFVFLLDSRFIRPHQSFTPSESQFWTLLKTLLIMNDWTHSLFRWQDFGLVLWESKLCL